MYLFGHLLAATSKRLCPKGKCILVRDWLMASSARFYSSWSTAREIFTL